MKTPAFQVDCAPAPGTLHVTVAVDDARADLRDAVRACKGLPRPLPPRIDVRLAAGPLGSRGAAVLDRFCATLETGGAVVAVHPADAAQRRALEVYAAPAAAAPRGGRERGDGFDAAVRAVLLLRDTLRRGLLGFLYPGRDRTPAFVASLVDAGLRAVPLTFVLNFLIGGVLALQTAPFLAKYGQEAYVAQLVAVAHLREIGPLLTAILVAGRSGAALAAEIGAMKGAEELDALTVVGADPVDAVVAPRFRALLVALPLLTLLADFAGVLGGFAVGTTIVGVAPNTWWERTLAGAEVKDVLGGLLKSAAFATALTVTAAHQGFSAEGGAVGVGRRTTRAVVFGIIATVALDALFTFALYRIEE